jgi:serine/threonine protein kinase
MSTEIHLPGYTMLEQIGSGGMALVYRAVQDSLEREVAIKILRETLSHGSEEFRTRFHHEGQMLAQLVHPNIVPIYDIGSTDEVLYMAMEFLRGGTLSNRLKMGQISVGEVIRICAQIAMALNAAHVKQIIHRDLKPANIMFRDPLTPVLTDFGIARKMDLEQTLTKAGMMIGTPQYMSPEQIRGRVVDARSDIYSLGLMFYRMLTGQLPFRSTEPYALAMEQVNEPPPPLPEELTELQPVMDLMLAKEPEERYQSTLDFCSHLQSISLTDENYATELSEQTRIYDSSQLSMPSGGFSREYTSPQSAPGTAAGEQATGSSISTAIKYAKTSKKLRFGLIAAIMLLAGGLWYYSDYLFIDITDENRTRVDNLLERFDGYIRINSFYEPAGANATDTLRSILALAPDYPPALDAAERLAEFYHVDAIRKQEENDLQGALDFIGDGLEIAPDNVALLELQQEISRIVEEARRTAEISRLLAVGEQALENNNLIGPEPGHAYGAFKEVETLDANNETALTGLSEIQRRLVADAEATWLAGDAEGARSKLLEVNGRFPNSALVADLQQRIRNTERLAEEEQEIENLLSLAAQQFEQGTLIEPPAGNALESYRMVLAIRPDNTQAVEGLQSIADHYLAQAEQQLQAGDFQASLAAVSDGLKAVADDQDLLQVQEQATGRLDEKSREIQTRLQRAQRLASQGLLIPGAADVVSLGLTAAGAEDDANALEIYRSVEELDPGNAQAQSGIERIPAQLFALAQQFQRDEEYERAKSLLQAGLQQFPGEARYTALVQTLDAQMAEVLERQRLQDQLASLDALIAERPVTIDLINRFEARMQETQRLYPNEVSSSQKFSDFISAITEQADQISLQGQDLDALVLVDHALRQYAGNDRLLQSRGLVEGRRLQREEEERQRIAAMSGNLAIDAAPWGRVVEIRDQNDQALDLPGQSETPFTLSLLEGQYSVVVEGGEDQSRIELAVDVNRQQTTMGRADFKLMTAQAYFENSGWWMADQ